MRNSEHSTKMNARTSVPGNLDKSSSSGMLTQGRDAAHREWYYEIPGV